MKASEGLLGQSVVPFYFEQQSVQPTNQDNQWQQEGTGIEYNLNLAQALLTTSHECNPSLLVHQQHNLNLNTN